MTEEMNRRLLGLEARMARMESGVQVDQNIVRIGGDLEVKGAIQPGTPDITPFLALPELRALWPMSSVDEAGLPKDISGQGRHFAAASGNPPRGVSGLMPYASLDGATQWFGRNDEAGIKITGPLTFGGWFYHSSAQGVGNRGLLGKWTDAGNANYLLMLVNDTPLCVVSLDGGNANIAQVAGRVVQDDTWFFVAGRYTPSAELAICVNGVFAKITTGIPASIFGASLASLILGSYNNGAAANCLQGRAGTTFLCAAALTDKAIQNLTYQSAGGVGN